MAAKTKQTPNLIGIISLCLSCIALLLATVPPYIIEKKIQELKQERIESVPAVTFEVKGVKLSFGKKTVQEPPDNSAEIEKLNSISQIATIALILFSIAAIFTAIYYWSTERKNEISKKISIGSVVTACVALSWQYVGAGISTGIAVFIVIMLLANFG